MEWLKGVAQKCKALWEKMRPVMCKIGTFCKKAWKSITIIGSYLFKLRAVVLSAPVAAAAAVMAVINSSRLPNAVQITEISINTQAENSLFGCLVMNTDYIARDVAVFGPLMLTIACLLLTMCSKRTLYPWLISVFTLVLPLVLLFTNVYSV